MRRLALTTALAIALTYVGAVEAHTTHMRSGHHHRVSAEPATGPSDWLRASRMPVPRAVLHLNDPSQEVNCGTPRDCVALGFDPPLVFLNCSFRTPDNCRDELFHEYGHVADSQWLTENDRWRFRSILDGEVNESANLGQNGNVHELLAEGWRHCAEYADLNAEGVTAYYGYHATAQQQAQICELFGEAATR